MELYISFSDTRLAMQSNGAVSNALDTEVRSL